MSLFSRINAPWSFHQTSQPYGNGHGPILDWTHQWRLPIESLLERFDNLIDSLRDRLSPEIPKQQPEMPSAPVITVDTKRTEGLMLEEHQASIRGITGDPTDPALTRGIAFSFTDEDTPREQLSVTIESSDPEVARAALDDHDVLRIAPVNAGNATITVTVSDGERDSQYTIDYAAADGSQTNNNARFHTGASDTSAAIAIGNGLTLVGDDEDQTLRLYDHDQSGAPLKSFNLNEALGLEEGEEVDIESIVDAGNGQHYWLGSLQDSERSTVFATQITGDDAASLEVEVAGQFSGLDAAIERWAEQNRPEMDFDGFEVEGSAYADGTLFLGLRAPIDADGRALVLPVLNIESLMASGSADGAQFGAALTLDLDGRTVRDIAPAGDGTWLISAGPANPGDDDGDPDNDNFQLYRWDGAHKVAQVEEVDLNTNANATGGTAETLSNARIHDDGSVTLDIAYDNGTTDWSDTGTASKDLDDDIQTFTSATVTFDALPSLEPAVGDVAFTALDSNTNTFSFVALDAIATGTTLTFTSGDSAVIWTAPQSGLAAGSVVDFTANAGSFTGELALSLADGVTITANGETLYRAGLESGENDLTLPGDDESLHYAGSTSDTAEALLKALSDASAWQTGGEAAGDFTIDTGHAPLPPPEPQDLGIAISEIWSGQSGSDVTEDWFEITNTSDTGIDFNQTPLYYDDDSADPEEAVQVQGLTTLAPGATAIVMVDGDEDAVAGFREAWSSVDLDGQEIGYTGSAAGLGSGGDQVTLWLGEPDSDTLAAEESYPDTEAFDAASWDVAHQRFITLENGGTASDALGGDGENVPAVATPGRLSVNNEGATSEGSLLITEYVEGSGYNKAIELTNRGGSDLSLEGFTLSLYANGNTDATAALDLGQYGTLAADQTLVLANTQADRNILDRSDDTSGVINHNGNDAFVLAGADGEILDIVGTIGDDAYFARDVTLRRDTGITEGSERFDDAQWQTYPQDSVDDLGNGKADSGEAPDNEAPGDDMPDDGMPDNNGDDMDLPPVELISTLQGSSMSSEHVGEQVSVEAIVTLDARDGLEGVFLQEEDADQDDDELTSEGIFVYLPDNTSVADVAVGDRVRLTGTVEEYQGKTELTDISALEVTARNQPLPTLTEVDLPIADKSTLAALESMRVSFQGEDGTPLTVTDTYELGRYGSVTLSSGGRLEQYTEINAPNQAGYQQWLDQIESRSILLDDASNAQNPAEILLGRGGEPLSADNTLRGGDTLEAATGVLDFAYQQWRLQSDQGLNFQPANPRPEQPDAQTLEDAPLKVASFNVLNYFETLDQSGNQITTPEGTEHGPRGANSEQELIRQQDKLVSAILDSDADIAGLMEVANDGYGEESSIAGLVEALNARSEAQWDYITPRDDSGNVVSPGSDAIAVGLIYQRDSVTPEGNAAINTSGAFATGNRAPMLQTFQDNDSGETFSIAVNHFKSKGSVINGEEAIGDGQGNNNPTRVEAAEQLAAWIGTDPTGSGDSDVLIIGDLNSYAMEDPITTLQGEGYTLLDDDYSYSYDGQWGSLDHALASASMSDQVTGTTTWHINADEPTVLDYNTEYKSPKQIEALYNDAPFRASDHDPIIIGIDPGSDAQQAAGF